MKVNSETFSKMVYRVCKKLYNWNSHAKTGRVEKSILRSAKKNQQNHVMHHPVLSFKMNLNFHAKKFKINFVMYEKPRNYKRF